MPLVPSTKLGPYEIAAAIGAGGMGEVYRARDTRLGRDVAIKVLPDAFARDASRTGRFEREARAIAALSHPNVLAVFDTGVAPVPGHDGPVAYVVMELLEGQTLEERLEGGALAVRKAIEIGIQIARGLSAAHDKGLVHRDLKPANVFLTTSGHVKILDFGLARAMESAPDAPSQSETRAAITDAGMVVGTIGYMAPEQVRGRALDARADLFALGLVLHEMLTGQRAFRRDTPAETMTAILKDDAPELIGQRADLSPALDRIVRHCLEKDPNDRFQSARDVAFALESLSGSDARAASPASGTAIALVPARGRALERSLWAALTLGLAALAAFLRWSGPPPEPPAFATPHLATLLLPDGVRLATLPPPGRRIALSPDGTMIAFAGVSSGLATRIWVQSLRDPAAHVVQGSENGSSPFWSPDSRTLAFASNGKMMKVEIGNQGAPVAFGPQSGSGMWSKDARGEDLILTGVERGQFGGIQRLDPQTGAATPVLMPADAVNENYSYPQLLPDRTHLLFSYYNIASVSAYGVYAAELGSSAKRMVSQSQPELDAINSYYALGYVVGARSQMISARAFDPKTMTMSAQRVELAGPVETTPRSSSAFTISNNGVLAYQPSSSRNEGRLTVFDRSGKLLGTLGEDAEYSNLELSPDGKQMAVSILDPAIRTRDIWVVDLARGTRTRVTFDPSDERSAVWTPDGSGLIYTSKGLDLYTKTLGAGAETPFIKDGISKDPRGWSPDGQYFIYRATGPGTRNDLWIKKRGEDKSTPFLVTPFDENYATFSPDGRFVAYVSDESGRPEVYATAFPSGQGKWPISSGGGAFPAWRRDSKEIVYQALDGRFMSVAMAESGALLTVGTAEPLFQASLLPGPGTPFVLTSDGQHLVVNAAVPTGAPPSIVLLYNWPALLKK